MLAVSKSRCWFMTVPVLVLAACGGDAKDPGTGLSGAGGSGGTHMFGGAGKGSGATGGTTIIATTGGSGGTSGTAASAGSGSPAGGSAGMSMCAGQEYEQKTSSALDIYFVFDRTASMGKDCAYVAGDMPPVSSKACYATYAVSDYLINVASTVDTRLAFQFMSQPDDCDGTPYETPLVALTQLPVAATDPLIGDISNETFQGGLGTHIEGALRGMAAFTAAHRTAGREMIGVLMTDGDPSGCDEKIPSLSTIISDQLQATGIRTFIIGMEGATDQNLESLATAGGADPHSDWCGSLDAPCHYWNVGAGSGDAISNALTAIVEQAAPIPCEFAVSGFAPPAGQKLDFGKVNVTLTDHAGKATTIGQVPNQAGCPDDVPAWYYDNPAAPAAIELCKNACTLVTAAESGAHVSVVVGCQDTLIQPPVR
jgi:hypothetical protein